MGSEGDRKEKGVTGRELIPSLPEGWVVKRLVDCTLDKVISYGIVQPGQHTDSGIPMIRVNNFGNGQLDLSTVLKVKPEIESKFLRTRLVGGEVLLTLVGSTGQSIVAPKELAGWNVPRAVAVIRVTDDIGADWINICLQTEFTKHFLDSRANTTVQKTLNLSDVRKIPIPIPPQSMKEFIESNIVSLEKKIQLNRQTNQTLEQMAQALFKSWFVDFDPVIDNALAAGNPIPPELEQKAQVRAAAQASQAKPGAHPHDHASELPQHLRELFPSEFEHTEALGWVPKGWGVGSLSDIADYEKEKTNTAELNLENYVSTENMNKEKSGISTAAKLASTDQVPIFSVGQTLISNIRPYFKKIWFASFNGGRSNDVLCFQAKYKDVNEYLYSLLYQDTFFEYMTVTSKGTKMPRGDKKAIMDWPVVLPTLNLMEEFSKIIKPSFLANQLRITESSTLIQMRDTLLPKLISGELRLPVAETDAPSLTDEASV